MVELLPEGKLPQGFEYPREFLRVVELGLTNLEPWWIIDGPLLEGRFGDIAQIYPSRTLVLFAVRVDRDDVACWDLAAGNVAVIHDGADEGREQRATFADFNAWLRAAIDDLIEFE